MYIAEKWIYSERTQSTCLSAEQICATPLKTRTRSYDIAQCLLWRSREWQICKRFGMAAHPRSRPHRRRLQATHSSCANTVQFMQTNMAGTDTHCTKEMDWQRNRNCHWIIVPFPVKKIFSKRQYHSYYIKRNRKKIVVLFQYPFMSCQVKPWRA